MKIVSSETIDSWIKGPYKKYRERYSLELVPADENVIGLPGRDSTFQESGLVTIPPIPHGIPPVKDDEGGEVKLGRVNQKHLVPVVACLRKFGPEQCIVAGELNSTIYDERFLATLEDELRLATGWTHDGVLPYRTQIVCGPVVMIRKNGDRDRIKRTVLPELINNPDVDVFCSLTRQPEHFRLAPMAVYWERWHRPNEPERWAHKSYYDPETLVRFQKKKIAILTDKKNVKPVETLAKMKECFVFMTAEELKVVLKADHDNYPEDEMHFDSLKKKEVLQIAKDEG
ncbi:MAG: hypothetical protein OEV80_12825, partial [candidate division Zixibacteria bacterium]|nr:hypothetical protein [candidate division Zixibacteria bacterium]